MVTPIEIKGKTLGFIDSRIGGRKENQDSAGLKKTKSGYLVVVCDGMGGMQGGRIASQLAVQKILEVVASADKQANPAMTLIKAIQNANIAIIEEGKNNPEIQGMGTTVTALLLTPYSAITAHVGDSRIYQIRNGKKIFRTFDHSMVFEMVKKNVISEEQARSFTFQEDVTYTEVVAYRVTIISYFLTQETKVRWQKSQLGNLALVETNVTAYAPLPIFLINNLCVQREFNTIILH